MISRTEFLVHYGDAVRRGTGAMFVGAGMSVASGLPDWNQLIAPLRAEANVPDEITDAPIAAEYILAELGEHRMRRLLLDELTKTAAGPSDAVRDLMRLAVPEYWTTNYDTLLEEACEDSLHRVVADEDYAVERPADAARRLTKLHGSLDLPDGNPREWQVPPVIARSDYERFEFEHPLKWSMLRAQFLTSSFLFLGFSFDDPNINALLRIVRSLPPGLRRAPHYAVIRRPADTGRRRVFDLFAADLHRAGIHVLPIDDFGELDELVRDILLHAREPNLFIAGRAETDVARLVCAAVGAQLKSMTQKVTLLSLGGSAALRVALDLKSTLLPGEYRPERMRVYYRRSEAGDGVELNDRVGMAVFTDLDLDALRTAVFAQTRALLLVGDGTRVRDEVALARAQGIPVVPIAMSGRAARDLWTSATPASLGLEAPDVDVLWARLNDPSVPLAVDAARSLLSYILFAK